MLSELENGLVSLVKSSRLGSRLRQVDTLPDLDGDSLIGRFGTDAPAVYVALGSFPAKQGMARPKFGIACVARNSRSHQAARQGDGMQIGLHEMLEAVMALADGATVSYGSAENQQSVSFEVLSCDMVSSEALYQKGIYSGVVQVQAVADVPIYAGQDNLADFITFHADYDIDPHQASTEHNKWLQEPPDNSTSAPELSDNLTLPQE